MREAQAGEEVKSCCGERMVKKEEFIEKMDKQLKEWDADERGGFFYGLGTAMRSQRKAP
ncbi:MAG: hypothetical protein HQL30_02410 [Candidatus Omnitrophica bacterium]|nr:hypothetical protein [Candidatus Omnitrophota bacterium]